MGITVQKSSTKNGQMKTDLPKKKVNKRNSRVLVPSCQTSIENIVKNFQIALREFYIFSKKRESNSDI